MTDSAAQALTAIRSLVEQAKAVPMTSSVIVSRADLLALLDEAQAAGDPGRPAAPLEPAEVADARAEAERILAEARQRAEALVAESEVVRSAEEEAQALKVEADTWVDGRLAELEAGLQRTLEQIETMRERLHQRSRLDERE